MLLLILWWFWLFGKWIGILGIGLIWWGCVSVLWDRFIIFGVV